MNAARLLATALAQTQPGKVFAGHRLLDELGRGAMGVVFSACHLASKRIVALKMPRADADPPLVQRFRSEAEAAAALDHPGILPIHEVGECDGVPFFTMRFAECGSLAERAGEFQSDPRAAVELVVQVADALAHAHERGLLHRDVKPSNILLVASDEPLLGDFGLARWLGRDSALTIAGSVLGTPSYLAPELLGEKPEATTTSDLFSLGAVLYHLLCGRPPFTGETVATTLAQVAEATPPAPRSLNAALPRDLEAIVLRSIEREPVRRYGSVREFAADLRRFLAGEPVIARATSPVGVAWRWCRRRPAYAALIALLAAVTVGSFVMINAGRSRLADALNSAELDRAEDLLRAGDSADGLALLARVVRRNSSHPVAGPRLASALWHGNFAMPLPPPFFAGGYVRRMNLLHDGRTLLICRTDGVATWDAASGQRLIEFENDGSRGIESVLSPDERTLVAWKTAAGANFSILDVGTGRLRVAPIQHKDWIHTIEFSPDSTSFVTASNDKTARIYDVQTGKAIGEPMTHPVGLWCAVFSPDGGTIATCAGATMRLWDSHTHLLLRELPPCEADLWRLRYSPDGRWLLAVSHQHTMRLFAATDGQPASPLMRHEDTIRSETFSADGLRLLTASNDYTARQWSVPGGEPLSPPMRHRDAVTFAGFSPDGTRIATCSVDHTARVWDTRTARPLTQPLHHFEQPRAAVFTPDGSRLLASGADRVVQTWDLPAADSDSSKKFLGTLAEFSADGRLAIAVAPAGQPFVWDASTAQSLSGVSSFDGVARLARLAPDAQSAAVVSESGELAIVALAGPARPPMVIVDAKGISDVCFNANGTRIAAASQSQTARVWNTATGEALTPPLAHGAPVASVRFSPDGRTLLSATVSPANSPPGLDAARLWDIATGQLIGKPMQHIDDVCAAEFSSDGKLVATASEDNDARVWDARTGEAVSPVLRHTRTVGTIAFSPDALRVVTSSWDGTARVWDAHSGAPLARPLRHDDYVLDARFSPDGRRIVTASRDKTVRLWDAETGRPLTEPLRHDAAVVQVRFHPDGQRVIASTADTARIWEVPDFSARQPEWLVELAEAISRPDLPSSAAATRDAIAQYERIRAHAMDVSRTDVYSQLAQRLFSRSGATASKR